MAETRKGFYFDYAIDDDDSLRSAIWADNTARRNYSIIFKISVAVNPSTLKLICSYRIFERIGILCRHIIWIFSSNGMKFIPEDYITKRLTKDTICFSMFNSNGEGAEDIDNIDGTQIATSTMWSEFNHTIGILRGRSKADIESFSTIIKEFKDNLSPFGEALNKKQQLVKILGCTTSEEVKILPPKNLKNKCSGKTMLSSKTKAVVKASKLKRM
ncbi:uncharacterized protein LOC141628738 [Silene latifolia]|uniref:uncharacterized protein LOC141628738 n=1 Tax=Silene latifolia TaxID=37657 RepID=UPI003D77D671